MAANAVWVTRKGHGMRLDWEKYTTRNIVLLRCLSMSILSEKTSARHLRLRKPKPMLVTFANCTTRCCAEKGVIHESTRERKERPRGSDDRRCNQSKRIHTRRHCAAGAGNYVRDCNDRWTGQRELIGATTIERRLHSVLSALDRRGSGVCRSSSQSRCVLLRQEGSGDME